MDKMDLKSRIQSLRDKHQAADDAEELKPVRLWYWRYIRDLENLVVAFVNSSEK